MCGEAIFIKRIFWFRNRTKSFQVKCFKTFFYLRRPIQFFYKTTWELANSSSASQPPFWIPTVPAFTAQVFHQKSPVPPSLPRARAQSACSSLNVPALPSRFLPVHPVAPSAPSSCWSIIASCQDLISQLWDKTSFKRLVSLWIIFVLVFFHRNIALF